MTRRSRIARSGFIGAVAFLVTCAPRLASSQPVVDPTRTEFSPSNDHSVTLPDGSLAVDRYELELYLSGQAQPFQRLPLGKPVPDPDGMIRVSLTSLPIAWQAPGSVYVATIAAVGAGGVGRSELTNTFSFSTACTFAVSPTSQSAGAAGGALSVSVTADAGCGWTAVSTAAWIGVIAGSSGAGSGVVTYTVAANTSPTARTGGLTVAGRTVTVSQAGAQTVPCSVAVSPTSQTVPAKGGPYTFTVTAGTGCGWTATASDAWMTITAGTAGTGNGSVNLVVADNRSSTTLRSGTLTIGGQIVTVTQKAPSAPRPPKGLVVVK